MRIDALIGELLLVLEREEVRTAYELCDAVKHLRRDRSYDMFWWGLLWLVVGKWLSYHMFRLNAADFSDHLLDMHKEKLVAAYRDESFVIPGQAPPMTLRYHLTQKGEAWQSDLLRVMRAPWQFRRILRRVKRDNRKNRKKREAAW